MSKADASALGSALEPNLSALWPMAKTLINVALFIPLDHKESICRPSLE